MNRKNLTAAVLAGLAGVAGLAGTAQAVNLNPDGLGQVLMYPYYTTNGGNSTLLSVVNTTDQAKAVKVRFLEGFNSREVLDFNLYMSPEDVWTAGLIDGSYMGIGDAGTTYLVTQDMSCTVPYLYASGPEAFRKIAYNDNGIINKVDYNFADGGPTGIERASEGHFEMIEMGTIMSDTDTYDDILHQEHPAKKDKDGNIEEPAFWAPGDCKQLTTNWTRDADGNPKGDWTKDPYMDISRNSGGLFGGAAIVNEENGTMYSYNAAAIQGFDKTDGLLHFEPGTIFPSLNSGSEKEAWVFFGVPQNKAKRLSYSRSVDAVSALFMHEHIMNEFTVESIAAASTEWVVTFPTKNWYVDEMIAYDAGSFLRYYEPDADDPQACNGWQSNDDNPLDDSGFLFGSTACSDFYMVNGEIGSGLIDPNTCERPTEYENCDFVFEDTTGAIAPFTKLFDGDACEDVELSVWDREEIKFGPGTPTGPDRPPVVSPSLPTECTENCDSTPFQLCYEVNVLRFMNVDGGGDIFGTPDFGDDGSLLLTVTLIDEDEDYTTWSRGWGMIDLYSDTDHMDRRGLVGLPTSGFAAYEFENNFVEGGDVKAYYGGLYGHKGNVRRVSTRSMTD